MTMQPALDIAPAELEDLFELPAFENDKGYRLVALDDDRTPMDFVTIVFMQVFELESERAIELMLQIHVGGRAEVFKGSFDECKNKKDQIDAFNEKYEEHLFTLIEKIDD
jgi:ATP-dependent Clp protease adaptor protein ClpS